MIERATITSVANQLRGFLAAEFDESGASLSQPDGIQFYYKMPATFASTGRIDLANSTLNQLMTRFFQAGSLNTRGDESASSWAPYLSGWIAWGSALLGRFDHGRTVLRSIVGLQSANGGFRTGAPQDSPTDIQRTGAALMGLVWNFEITLAKQAASFLRGAIEGQAGRTQFCALVGADGQAIADPNDRNTYFEVGDEFARPAMFATPIAGLIWLFRLTGELEHLRTASAYMQLVLRHKAAGTLPLATKIGWAALLLHEHKPDPRLVHLALDAASDQAQRQQQDGSISFAAMEGEPVQLDKVWLVGWGCDCLLTLATMAGNFPTTGDRK